MANESPHQWAYLNHYRSFVPYKHADQALFGFATFELVCFAPALLLGLLMQPCLCLNICQITLKTVPQLISFKDVTTLNST